MVVCLLCMVCFDECLGCLLIWLIFTSGLVACELLGVWVVGLLVLLVGGLFCGFVCVCFPLAGCFSWMVWWAVDYCTL